MKTINNTTHTISLGVCGLLAVTIYGWLAIIVSVNPLAIPVVAFFGIIFTIANILLFFYIEENLPEYLEKQKGKYQSRFSWIMEKSKRFIEKGQHNSPFTNCIILYCVLSSFMLMINLEIGVKCFVYFGWILSLYALVDAVNDRIQGEDKKLWKEILICVGLTVKDCRNETKRVSSNTLVLCDNILTYCCLKRFNNAKNVNIIRVRQTRIPKVKGTKPSKLEKWLCNSVDLFSSCEKWLYNKAVHLTNVCISKIQNAYDECTRPNYLELSRIVIRYNNTWKDYSATKKAIKVKEVKPLSKSNEIRNELEEISFEKEMNNSFGGRNYYDYKIEKLYV